MTHVGTCHFVRATAATAEQQSLNVYRRKPSAECYSWCCFDATIELTDH